MSVKIATGSKDQTAKKVETQNCKTLIIQGELLLVNASLLETKKTLVCNQFEKLLPLQPRPSPKAQIIGQQVESRLARKASSVNIVTEEKILGVLGAPADLKQLEQIIVLPVNISHDSDWICHMEQVAVRDFGEKETKKTAGKT